MSSTGGTLVIAVYKPKPGQNDALKALVARHVPRLRELGLVMDRREVVMQAADGTILEVFEWKSQEAINQAHNHPEVQKLWNEFFALADMLPVNAVPESAALFAGYTPLN
ncbi:MAG: antibiotic biosynthesis monooxygenase [Gemmataceae bacterium]|nr:antibiotic biosynthesis monooxygenase [Gemmataceae bacterium]